MHNMGNFSQSEAKEEFNGLRKKNRFCDLNVITVAAVALSRSAQLSTAVRFGCGPDGTFEGAARRTGSCTSS
jgi:hypothetical protein